MPSTPYVPIHAIAEYKRGNVSETNHTIKAALISGEAGFLNEDDYGTYSDISGELYPYTGGHQAVTVGFDSLVEDNSNNRVDSSFNDAVWQGSGEGFGPVGGAVFWDDDTAEKTITGLLRFDDAQGNPTTFTIAGGQQFKVRNVLFRGKFVA